MYRIYQINDAIQAHDKQLFSSKDANGNIHIYRKHKSVESFAFEDARYFNVKETPILVLALTDNWTVNGKPVEWGIEPILKRLKEIDTWNRDNFFKELKESQERVEKSKERHLDSEAEAFAKDFRRSYNKMFGDINTSTLEKVDRRRDKEKKNAYCK